MAEVDASNLEQIARGRGSSRRQRITTKDQAPSLKVIHDTNRIVSRDLINNTIGGFDPDRITFKQMRMMRRDPMIAFGLHFVKTVIVNAKYHFESTDPQVAAFAKQAYDRIHSRLIFEMLTALEFGYAPIVLRFELDRPDWKYTDEKGDEKPVWSAPAGTRALVWAQPRGLRPEAAEVQFNDREEYNGFEHSGYSLRTDDARPIKVDAQHSLWFINQRDEEHGNWYGYPRTGYAFKFWWSSTLRQLLEDRHFEQDADPPLVVRVPDGESPHPATQQMVSNQEIGLYVGQALRDGSTIVMSSETYVDDVTGRPSGTYQWQADFLRGGENLGAFRASNEYLDVMKLRAIWVPEQALIEGKGGSGSRNVAATYGEAFVSSQATLVDAIDQAINSYMIKDLVAQNFVNPPEVKKVTTGFKEEDLSLAMDIIRILTSQDPAALQLDLRKLIQAVGLPQLTLEEQKARDAALGPVTGGQNPEQQNGETGGVGGSPQPQNVVRQSVSPQDSAAGPVDYGTV